MSKYQKRIYYKLDMTLASPMSIGSGKSVSTDHDVLVDSVGNAFIPGTSIAGVMRSSIPDTEESGYLASKIFGYVKTNKEETHPEFDSCIITYDARSSENDGFIVTRDSVKLEKKVGVDGAKFDLQAVETGKALTGYIELLDETYVNEVEEAIAKIDAGILRFGMKTSRGYGKVKLDVSKKVVATAKEWCAFKMFEPWQDAEKLVLDASNLGYSIVSVDVKAVGGTSIKEYSTNVNEPDYKSMALHSDKDKYVIPGTSWCGAIRDRFATIINDDALVNELFGFVDSTGKDKTTIKSKIIIDESIMTNGNEKTTTRNSIDRFSAATKDGALYTELTYFYGETTLNITVPADLDDRCKDALAMCIADLNNGFLAVGGLTAVGRGLFTVTAVNGSAPAKDSDGLITDIASLRKEMFA